MQSLSVVICSHRSAHPRVPPAKVPSVPSHSHADCALHVSAVVRARYAHFILHEKVVESHLQCGCCEQLSFARRSHVWRHTSSTNVQSGSASQVAWYAAFVVEVAANMCRLHVEAQTPSARSTHIPFVYCEVQPNCVRSVLLSTPRRLRVGTLSREHWRRHVLIRSFHWQYDTAAQDAEELKFSQDVTHSSVVGLKVQSPRTTFGNVGPAALFVACQSMSVCE